METKESWRDIVASSLGWEQAHATLENAVEGLPPEDRKSTRLNSSHH